ncbi:MAG: UDP-N-acetylmuramoyl-tripeptide--D-alanyl-D-alanine ligase [Clostridia bacterium]|nr:UDP-N-acetylmuramoyl-tripeptide--D-alanyl-D-alanine ligase [Clostridia bacterium]
MANGLWYTVLYLIIATAATVFAAQRFLHMMQLESYQGKMYLKWLKKHVGSEWVPFLMAGIIAILLRAGYVLFYYAEGLYFLSDILWYAGDAVYVILMLLFGWANAKKPQKKPLKYTGRVIRLIVALTVVVAVFWLDLFIGFDISSWGGYLLMNLVHYLPGLLLPLFVLLAWLITWPIENRVKAWYFNDAKKKLAARDIPKLAITGSYGKTSTKFILGTLIAEKYNTLFTPGSFNTPMGVTRVIREQLKEEHEVFIAEMGARYKGDIAELCRLVQPKYGIITSVGKQHLETFGSFEAVVSTKAELLRALPADGCAFINGDNEACRGMYESLGLENKYLFGLEGEGLYMRADEIETGEFGSRFTLVCEDGASIRCTTKLLGRHNILNITGAAACAYRLGLTMEEIASGIAKLEAVEHRLQLIPGPVTVIDDAFNANPEGSKYALQVLSEFKGRRIVITPGMIELGAEEDALNFEMGRTMADCADIAILVGKRRVEAIKNGLLEGGFEPSCIVQVNTLTEASEILPKYTAPGCVVLFENDLPDNFDE